ncbi:hypothetical protein LTR62_001563 [Meristemomyces frigidus]|uniref:Exoribonuclease phosphorolytic domain-containing protein n=1 Tax=Meristemomyces frigidus TaxID=1508187 RepID=A0AAN7TKB5_9PEZI|nr:hypothetical protein LTR62_001563 [Meristemomyces frigidus]
MTPAIAHHPLHRADGSATYSNNLYSVLAAANGPVEVQRRDELPEEAAIEVNVRPLSGIGGPRERWLESVLAAVLKSILLVHMHPRTLVQVTLQITKAPTVRVGGTVNDVSLLPSLVNAAFLAVVDAGLPLDSTVTAILLSASSTGEVLEQQSEKQLASSKRVHAFAYNHRAEMLLNESAGDFTWSEWEEVADKAEKMCSRAMVPMTGDEQMANGTAESSPWLRLELEQRAQAAVAWRDPT